MESVKKSVKNFGKGFGIWLILLLLNTRAGESSVNGIKIIMDTLLSIILIGNNKKAREAALGISALTVVVTCLKLPGDVEMLLLIGCLLYTSASLYVIDRFITRLLPRN